MPEKARFPSGPPGAPLLGHIAQFRRDPIGLFQTCARDYGDFVPLRFGPKQMILLSHPDYVEAVLVGNSSNFVKSEQFRAAEAVLGNGLVLSEGSEWLHQRRLMQPAFHRQRIAAYAETMVSRAEKTVSGWEDGQVQDIPSQMTHITLEVVAKTLLDIDAQDVAEELGTTISHSVECLSARMSSLWLLLPDTIPIPTNLRLHEAVRRLNAFIYPIIEQRRKDNDEDRGDLLSVLLQARDGDGRPMTDRQVRDECITLIAGGYETTATTLTWATYLLSQHPEVEARLVEEVSRSLEARSPTIKDLPDLKYAEWVIMETLRLYPPLPILGRQAIADCEIGGYPVPRGTSLLVSIWTLHRDARFFDQPDEFRPERWADGAAERLPRFAYFPFGGGPRLCIGQAFAMMEAILVLSIIVREFRLLLVPGQTIEPLAIPTMRPKHGLHMRLERREQTVLP